MTIFKLRPKKTPQLMETTDVPQRVGIRQNKQIWLANHISNVPLFFVLPGELQSRHLVSWSILCEYKRRKQTSWQDVPALQTRNLLREWEAAVAQCIFQREQQASTHITVKLRRRRIHKQTNVFKPITAQQTKQYTAYRDGKQVNRHKKTYWKYHWDKLRHC